MMNWNLGLKLWASFRPGIRMSFHWGQQARAEPDTHCWSSFVTTQWGLWEPATEPSEIIVEMGGRRMCLETEGRRGSLTDKSLRNFYSTKRVCPKSYSDAWINGWSENKAPLEVGMWFKRNISYSVKHTHTHEHIHAHAHTHKSLIWKDFWTNWSLPKWKSLSNIRQNCEVFDLFLFLFFSFCIPRKSLPLTHHTRNKLNIKSV